MGIQHWASPGLVSPGGPRHCIEQLPPLPPGGGEGTTRQEEPAYPSIYAVPEVLQGLILADRSFSRKPLPH